MTKKQLPEETPQSTPTENLTPKTSEGNSYFQKAYDFMASVGVVLPALGIAFAVGSLWHKYDNPQQPQQTQTATEKQVIGLLAKGQESQLSQIESLQKKYDSWVVSKIEVLRTQKK